MWPTGYWTDQYWTGSYWTPGVSGYITSTIVLLKPVDFVLAENQPPIPGRRFREGGPLAFKTKSLVSAGTVRPSSRMIEMFLR